MLDIYLLIFGGFKIRLGEHGCKTAIMCGIYRLWWYHSSVIWTVSPLISILVCTMHVTFWHPKWQIIGRIIKWITVSNQPSCSSCPPVTWTARLTWAHQSPPFPTTSTLSCPLLLSRCPLRARKSSRTSALSLYEVGRNRYMHSSIYLNTEIRSEWIC